MKKTIAIVCACALLAAGIPAAARPYTADRLPSPAVSRVPEPGNRVNGRLDALPAPNEESGDYDLRDADLSGADLSDALEALQRSNFTTLTVWPEGLPEGFDPVAALEQGKNPGLGLRALHERGVTGKGVGIGIIDQTLLTGHREYAGRLRYYREYGQMKTWRAQMHGAAVSSIALGETTGVAPEALLYFIADASETEGPDGQPTGNISNRAKDIEEFIALNETLPEDEKIRVISISRGWLPDTPGAKEMEAAIGRARDAGIAVIWVSDTDPLASQYMGVGREWMSDPDTLESPRPPYWQVQSILDGETGGETGGDSLLVPFDARTLAAPEGDDVYVFYRNGAMSWAIPYVAGLYALAWQEKPSVTFAEFTAAARATARPAAYRANGQSYPLGSSIDPAALLKTLAASK